MDKFYLLLLLKLPGSIINNSWYLCFFFLNNTVQDLFLHIRLKIACSVLKLCMKRNCDITQLFPDMTMFFYEKSSGYEVIR